MYPDQQQNLLSEKHDDVLKKEDISQKRKQAALARSNKLTSKERSDIAKKAAQARWEITAICSGKLKIGQHEVTCHVLENEERVVSGWAMKNVFFGKDVGGDYLLKFLKSKIWNFIDDETKVQLENPIRFKRVGSGGSVPDTTGHRATVLIDICDAMLTADEHGVLKDYQGLVITALSIIRSMAKVGIVSLVDEATGYQYIRSKTALAEFLDKTLGKELAKWVKTFPDEFYKEMYRLKGWEFIEGKTQRPSIVGKYTLDIVYRRLGPGLLSELNKRNPKNDIGRRKTHHHRWFSTEEGHPELVKHIETTIDFMKSSDDWNDFLRRFNRVRPIYEDQIPLLQE